MAILTDDDAFRQIIDYLSRLHGLGTLSEVAANSTLGINHRGYGNPQPTNTDNHGLTFFTRPNLNLTYDNLQADRRMMPLASQDPTTYQRAIRNWLDPDNASKVPSTLVDPLMPFITVLTNNLQSISGWPDPFASTFSTKEGNYKEVLSMMDGPSKHYGSYQLTATFRNIGGDPISLLIYYWLIYGLRVTDGSMVPHPYSMTHNEIDYNTRIYRFVLDPSRRFIQKVLNCGAAFPVGVPLGAAGNFDSDQPYNLANAMLSIQFECNGCEINDPIAFEDFNRLMVMFNPYMQDGIRQQSYIQLKPNELLLFNYYGYPWVDITTQELQWWVDPVDYATIGANPMITGA